MWSGHAGFILKENNRPGIINTRKIAMITVAGTSMTDVITRDTGFSQRRRQCIK